MDPVKTVAIKDATKIQEFIGFANFYYKFIRDYSGVLIFFYGLN